MKMGVGEFKARCLALIEEVRLENTGILLTKRGKPMARVLPLEMPEPADGCLLGTVHCQGDWK
jgi:prevent-host-death family protein